MSRLALNTQEPDWQGWALEVWHGCRNLDVDHAQDAYEAAILACGDPLRRELARVDLFYLLYYLLHRHDMGHPWLYARIREVEVARDWHLDLWGREHRKSSILNFGCTIQDILAAYGDNPLPDWRGTEPTFCILSHTATNAQKFLTQIKTEFENNLMLRALFPDILYENPTKDAQQWSNAGIIVKRKINKREATIEAYGLDSLPTGAHFDVLLYDDVIDLGSVNTPDMIENAIQRWEMSISLGVTEGGRQRYIGTRYGVLDPYHAIMQRDIVKVRIYPSTDDGTATGKPVLFSPEEHEKRRRSMGPATFASQWLQKPVSKGTATFDIEHLRFAEIRPKTINVYILCDPANSMRKGSDKTAIAVIAVDAQANKYLVDGYNHRMNLDDRWEALKGLRKRWMNEAGVQSVQVFVERYGMQTDIDHFLAEMRRDGNAFDITELAWPRQGGGSKGDRISRLYPDFANGHFFLPLLVRDSTLKLCFLKVVEGEIKYQPAIAETKLMRQMKTAGQLYRVLRPIQRKDEEGRLYDLSTRFIIELLAHPALGASDDLIDAVSRIYDCEVRPPIVIDPTETEPVSYVDS